MITGDVAISPNNLEEIKALTNDDNKYGGKVKVVIISKAAAEGIDLKNVRFVHLIEGGREKELLRESWKRPRESLRDWLCRLRERLRRLRESLRGLLIN